MQLKNVICEFTTDDNNYSRFIRLWNVYICPKSRLLLIKFIHYLAKLFKLFYACVYDILQVTLLSNLNNGPAGSGGTSDNKKDRSRSINNKVIR